MARVTLAEIAGESGVSQSTVSLVLRNKPGVGSDTRQHVLEVAQKMGYIPKHNARSHPDLANVGLILKAEPGRIPQANRFYSRVLAGIEAACRERRFNLLYATMPVDQDSYPVELPRMLLEETAHALLCVGAFLNETVTQVIERLSTPVVLVDAYAASNLYDAVVSDNVKGARQATEYLIQRGHRHIGFVGSHPQAYPSIQERLRGYREALEANGIDEQYLADCHIIDREGIRDATTDLLRQSPEITALLGANDEVAIAALEAARALGREIPGDLSVMGFDNIDLSETVSPSLTTMHVDKVGMGRLAVQLLVNRVEYPESSPVTAVIHPHLVERRSVRDIE